MGTPDFAVKALSALISKYNVVAVYTKEPKPVGRKQIITKSPVHIMAEENNIPVRTPKNFKDESVVQELRDFHPDIIVVAAYGIILPESVLCVAPMGAINIHASLLPKYRGANPIQRAVIAGDKETGITIMKMDKGMDTGDMLLKEKIAIDENITYGELEEKLSKIGAKLIIEYLENMEKYKPIKQPEEYSVAPKLDKGEAKIDWNSKTAEQIHNLVRGLSPYPFAYFTHNENTIKIIKSQVVNGEHSDMPAGSVMDKSIKVACADGSVLQIMEVQKVGSKPMPVKAFLNGYKLEIGEKLR